MESLLISNNLVVLGAATRRMLDTCQRKPGVDGPAASIIEEDEEECEIGLQVHVQAS